MVVDKIIIKKLDDVHVRIICDNSIAYELSDFFAFKAPNFWFHPLFKSKVWDGTIRLFSVYSKKLYIGLIPYLENFTKARNYELIIDPALLKNESDIISPKEIKKCVDNLNIHVLDKVSEEYTPINARDYQLWSIWWAIKNDRGIIISPTSSGKSFMIYCLVRYYQNIIKKDKKILIIVPTIGLVTQMFNDFEEYSHKDNGWFADKEIHTITGGEKKISKKTIYVSTWQSIYKLKENYFKAFEAVLGDECHLFQAKSTTKILKNLKNCPYKLGFTGTLGSETIHKLVLEGLFGRSKKFISTKELMDRKEVAELSIKCLVLNYPKVERMYMKKRPYAEEDKFIISHKKRNLFISNLAISRKGNTLILINRIKHGEDLYKLINKKIGSNRNVYLVNGSTKKEEREKVRIIVEKETDAVIIASVGVFATGTSIKNIFNVIFGNSTKSEIRVFQSIGRGLRISKTKESVNLYDVVDNLSYKKWTNYLLKHFKKRISMYKKEEFNFKIYKFDI